MQKILNYIRNYGGIAADALLEPGCQYFFTPEIEGFIGYRIFARCAVVYGDPVCRAEEAPLLAEAFHQQLKSSCKNIVYLAASQHFAHEIHPKICRASMEFGEEYFLDPHCNPKKMQGSDACVIRRKINKAIKTGVSVVEYIGSDKKVEDAIQNLGRMWEVSRRGPQMHIANIHLFENRAGKRWFYALQDKNVVGIAVINQLQSSNGWFLNNVMCLPQPPSGTQELLVDTILEKLEKENCTFVSFGTLPAGRLGEIKGLSEFSSWAARYLYRIVGNIFPLKGHKMFWRKFFPESRPSYLLFLRPRLGFREVYAVMKASNASMKL